ncbi:hypothetical protein SRABI83_01200 [Arthrobacter sp. Bi83]|jgi:hypothetical protein|nr:hypothetical protein SRABI83_01200 [Arthrobacter sp. Bi83]
MIDQLRELEDLKSAAAATQARIAVAFEPAGDSGDAGSAAFRVRKCHSLKPARDANSGTKPRPTNAHAPPGR